MDFSIILLSIVIIAIEVIHYQERKDLYNRIMARDLTDLKQDHKPIKVENIIKRNMRKNLTQNIDE